MKNSPSKTAACLLAAGLLLGACTSTAGIEASRAGEPPEGGEPRLAQFSDVPIPDGASMDVERSLILGPREAWIGRLVFTTSMAPQPAFEFYAREMAGFGWREVTRVRAKVNVLTFTRGDRAATIQIAATTLGGSEINMTMSPLAQALGKGGGALR